MKKLIAISITLVLAASAAFAQVTVGGSVKGAWQIIDYNPKFAPDNVPDPATKLGPLSNAVRERINISAATEDGKLGAWAQLRVSDKNALRNVWWQPISQLKFTLGYSAGYGPMGVASAEDDILGEQLYGRTIHGGSGSRVFQAWGAEVEQAAMMELFPMENLYIVAIVPVGDQSFAKAADTFAQTGVQVGYTIDGIGKIALSYDGGTNRYIPGTAYAGETSKVDPDSGLTVPVAAVPQKAASFDVSYFNLGFTLTAVENLTAYVGFEMPLPASEWVPSGTYQEPMEVHLRAQYTSGAFSVIGGVAIGFLGSTNFNSVYGVKKYEDGLAVGFTLNPSFDAGIAKVGLIAEGKFTGKVKYDGKEQDKTQGQILSFIPYVQKNVGSGSAWAGVKITTQHRFNDNKDPINLAVPVGLVLWF